MGLTHGTLGAILVSDLILGRPNPWAQMYDPARKPYSSLGEFAKENVNVPVWIIAAGAALVRPPAGFRLVI